MGGARASTPDEIRAMNNNWTMGLGEWDVVLDLGCPTDMALVNKGTPVYNLMPAETRLDAGISGLLALSRRLFDMIHRILYALRSTPVSSPRYPRDGAGWRFRKRRGDFDTASTATGRLESPLQSPVPDGFDMT